MRILVAGTGFTGSRILQTLHQAGHEVWGLNRRGENAAGIPVLQADVLEQEGLRALEGLPAMDLLISTLSGTGERDPERYRAIYVDGPRKMLQQLKWRQDPQVWMLGSTGVYGGADGDWVTEDTPADPVHPAGKVQREAERALAAVCDHHCVLRLSGLYGPGRTRLIRQALRKRPYLKPDLWANQIHADDVAGLVQFLVARQAPPSNCLLVSDREPAPRREIFDWVRAECRLPDGKFDEDHPRRATANRGNKRVDSSRMQALGYELKFPSFREGLRPLLAGEM